MSDFSAVIMEKCILGLKFEQSNLAKIFQSFYKVFHKINAVCLIFETSLH